MMRALTVFQKDIYKCVVEDTANLDTTIQQYLDERGSSLTVEEWKIENAEMLRKWAYPSAIEICRSLLKVHSNDPAIQAEGQAEIDILNGECEQIDNDFPYNTPQVAVITATVTREAGWNDNLGFRVVFEFSDPEYVPSNVALAVHSEADCGGTSYTTGALQFDGTNYYTICPAGHEPGDVDIHFGLLYAAANMGCWTLPAGVTSQEFLVYES